LSEIHIASEFLKCTHVSFGPFLGSDMAKPEPELEKAGVQRAVTEFSYDG
jgi:hypothetical protein